MIAMPFVAFLFTALLSFGDIGQLFALLATVGLVISYVKRDSKKTGTILLLDIVSFFLLASPVAWRLLAVPVHLFNYLAFIIPATIFVLFYITSLACSIRLYLQLQQSAN